MRAHRLTATALVGLGLGLGLGACSGKPKESRQVGSSAPHDLDLGAPHHATTVVPTDAAPSVGEDAQPQLPEPAIPTAPAQLESGGVDFIDDARLLFRVAACADAGTPLPDAVGHGDPKVAAVVASHCKRVLAQVTKFRASYFGAGPRRAWFDALVPADVPTTVVYPFGGGDLLSALVAFPRATEITTISLEQGGDPRRLRTLDVRALETSLSAFRTQIGGLVQVGSNTSVNLMAQMRNDLPAQASSFLLALVVAGATPVSMKYFTLDAAGAIHYVTQAEIDAADAKGKAGAKELKGDWGSPNFSEAFGNVEITYTVPGDAVPRVHRHFGWNLGNEYLAKHPELVTHLAAKGRVTVLVKGASYLLWRGDFSTIRDYLTSHLAWMLSDSTGIPPVYAKRAGMVQIPYGEYHGAFLQGAQGTATDTEFVDLWASGHPRSLAFRFGYTDADKHGHLLVTRPK